MRPDPILPTVSPYIDRAPANTGAAFPPVHAPMRAPDGRASGLACGRTRQSRHCAYQFQRGDSAEKRNSTMGTPSSSEIRYEFTPWDGTPGKAFDDDWETAILNAGSRSDDRGWSLSDHLLGQDEGSVGGPPIPGGAAGVKAQASLRKRQKESYKLVTLHIMSKDIVEFPAPCICIHLHTLFAHYLV
jgi:hypothetical protein